jgi:monoamine oxidase
MEHLQADVCVVGAGFAGLAAARHLKKANKSVIVLEARDRVGGRVWDKTAKDGTVISVGGTWLGVHQTRMKQLVEEVGLTRYRQYIGDVDPDDDPEDPLSPAFDCLADSIFRLNGKSQRYKGMFVPVGDDALANLGIAFEELDELAKTLPLGTPWQAPHARELDAQTLGEWIASPENVPIEKAQMMLRASLGLLFSVDLAKVSLLGSMVLARGGNGNGFAYYADASFTETHLIDGGGPPEVARRLGVQLGDSLRTSTPVRRIRHFDDHVEVYGDDVMVRASFVIITAPPILASQIEYDPMLPDEYTMLMEQMPSGLIVRGITVYEKPWWRDRGLSGFSVAPQSPITVSIDQCPKPVDDDTPPSRGILSSYAIGAAALDLMKMDEESRRKLWVKELADRFEDPAYGPVPEPIDHNVTDWAAEEWSRGGMISHFPPGVLTTVGSALHQPHKHIYWAGTERATAMHGLMEGAVRSGEQAAEAIIGRL